jgi:hypothetical protein
VASGADPSSINILSSTLRVLVDPYNDDNGNLSRGFERPSMVSVCNKLTTGGAVGASKWTSVTASKSSVTMQDWIGVTPAGVVAPAPALNAKGPPPVDPNQGKLSSVFAFVPGKLACFLPVCDLATLSMENIGLFVIADLGHSSNSVLRQNAMDNLKAKRELYLETPVRITVLASLAGVGAVLMNNWATSLASQGKYVETFWSKFTATGQQQNILSSLAAAKKCSYDGDGFATLAAAVAAPSARGTARNSISTARPEVKDDMKLWIKYSRVVVGIPFIGYMDA